MPASKFPKKKNSTKLGVKGGVSQLLCDGCLATVSENENELLKCSVCNVQVTATVPQRHYGSIAASFVCITCSLTASNSVVADLRNEISALKAELT